MPISTSEKYPFLLALGMGYSASRFVDLYGTRFSRIAATVRNPEKRGTLHGVEAVLFDGAASPELEKIAAEASHVLVSIPPGPEGDPALKALGAVFRASRNLRWVGYLSTTGVYGDAGGAWIDETAPLKPRNPRSLWRAEAEQAWRDLAAPGRAVQIFRLSGIYGPGRNALVDLENGTARRRTRPGQVFNRVHVDDIAQVLAAAVERPEAGPFFNLADGEPVPSHEVVDYAAHLLGMEPPPLIRVEDADLSDMARSFWTENKRVSARRVRAELGVELLYPTYREGLDALFAAGEGR